MTFGEIISSEDESETILFFVMSVSRRLIYLHCFLPCIILLNLLVTSLSCLSLSCCKQAHLPVQFVTGLPPLLEIREIRENWKAFFQSGKSQGIWHFFQKSGKNQGILITQYFFYILMRQYIFITDYILITLNVIKNNFILN